MDIHTREARGKPGGVSGQGGKYLTFSLGREDYGIGLLKVREINGLLPITAVPRLPGYVKGVVNLRGRVIPILDLRSRFGLPSVDYTDRTCIIIVEVQGGAGRTQMGLVVDRVSEVLQVKSEQVEPAPVFGAEVATDFILGLAKVEAGVKILLDIDKVLGVDQVGVNN